MELLIKEMTAADVSGVAYLEKICFSTPWTEEGIAEELKNNFSHFLVAFCDGKMSGYIGVQEICGEAYITNICVLPEMRRKGIADALLKAAGSGAQSRKCEFITLEVRESNAPAIALYEKQGFKQVGKRKGFYSSPAEDALLFTLYFEKVD